MRRMLARRNRYMWISTSSDHSPDRHESQPTKIIDLEEETNGDRTLSDDEFSQSLGKRKRRSQSRSVFTHPSMKKSKVILTKNLGLKKRIEFSNRL